MRFSTVFASSALVATALSATITVSVGKKGESADITFTPSSVKAAVGDIVQFKFWPKNHSVAQAAFAKPCEPLANGFWSGYVPTTDLATAASTTFEYTVTNASAPVWFYCTQGQHCTNGMVGVINENTASGNTLEKFAAA
ncbi:Cupredoxin, partial [Amniculicola lignicola CBS 123094]